MRNAHFILMTLMEGKKLDFFSENSEGSQRMYQIDVATFNSSNCTWVFAKNEL